MNELAHQQVVDQAIRLIDDRQLAYCEYGAPGGRPLFFFHGMPGSRYYRHPNDSILRRLNIRLIVPDRPGYGLSDFQPGRKLLDWPSDLEQLADHLGLNRFSVLGHSGGGPYVSACAYQIPDRLHRAGIISGLGPYEVPGSKTGMRLLNQIGLSLARYAPGLWMRVASRYFRSAATNTCQVFEKMTASHPGPDQAILADEQNREVCIQSYGEAFRAGTRGHAFEAVILSRPWGFRLEDVHFPILLWHGEVDSEVPVGIARNVSKALPLCSPIFYPGEGHLLMFPRWEEILTRLMPGQ